MIVLHVQKFNINDIANYNIIHCSITNPMGIANLMKLVYTCTAVSIRFVAKAIIILSCHTA